MHIFRKATQFHHQIKLKARFCHHKDLIACLPLHWNDIILSVRVTGFAHAQM